MTPSRGSRGARGRAFLHAWISLSLVLVAGPASAAEPDALSLMRESDQRHRIKEELISSSMVLQDSDGSERRRQLEFAFVQDDKAGDKTRVRFLGPAEIKGTALLSLEDGRGKSTEQWLYLPSFRKTRRIGASELGDRFVDSDIFYEDLKRRRVDDYQYKLLRTEKLADQDCFVIEAVPKDPTVAKETPYGRSQFWLRKDNLFIVKARFFDRDLKPLKETEATNLKQVTGQAWRAEQLTLVDVRRKHRTVLLVQSRKVNGGIGADAFSMHTLGAD